MMKLSVATEWSQRILSFCWTLPRTDRAIEENVLDRIGGRAPVVDVRVVAATNKDLKSAEEAREFLSTKMKDYDL